MDASRGGYVGCPEASVRPIHTTSPTSTSGSVAAGTSSARHVLIDQYDVAGLDRGFHRRGLPPDAEHDRSG